MGQAGRGAQRVVVPAARLPRWLAGFADRNGVAAFTVEADAEGWQVTAGAGRAHVAVPHWPGAPTNVASPVELGDVAATLDYAVLVVRRAGYLVAAIEAGRIAAGRSSSRHINGRTAAGGWSQKRYERRRGHQADEVVEAAAGHLADLIAGRSPAFLATGGDRPLILSALSQLGGNQLGLSHSSISPADRKWVARELPRGPHFQIGTPTRADLPGIPDLVTGVVIEILPGG